MVRVKPYLLVVFWGVFFFVFVFFMPPRIKEASVRGILGMGRGEWKG